LTRESKVYSELLVNAWTRMGEAWLSRHADLGTEGKAVPTKKMTRVKFSRIYTSEERIFYQIEVNKRKMTGGSKNTLPHRVFVKDLTSEETLFELSLACQRIVTASVLDPRKGAWVIVNRLQGFDGIPTYVTYNELLDIYPVDKVDKAPMILGIAEGRKPQIAYLSDHPHALVAGSTQGGKSNFINSVICNFLRFTDSHDLKIILIDLKRMEFGYYRDAPHLMRPIIFEADEAVTVLADLVKEIRRRADLLSNKAKELADWNKKYPASKMPRIVIVIDEFAELMLASGSEISHKIEILTTRITNLGRAVGIHMIVATQRPAVSVLPNAIKINMPLIISARVPNHAQSNVILGSSEAAYLPILPGRMIFLSGSNLKPIQTPHILDQDVELAVSISKGRSLGVIKLNGFQTQIDQDGLIVYIADCLQGRLAFQAVWDFLKQFSIEADELRGFLADLQRKSSITVSNRIFSIERYRNTWRLVEQVRSTPSHEGATQAPQDFTFTRPIPALRWIAAPAPLLQLSSGLAPLPTPEVVKPVQPPPASQTSALPEISPLLLTEEEIFEKFIKERCEVGPGRRQSFRDLYLHYCLFVKELDPDCSAWSKPILGAHLRKHFKRLIDKGNKTFYLGVTLSRISESTLDSISVSQKEIA